MLKYPFTHLVLSHICQELTILATNINAPGTILSFVAHLIFTITFQDRYCYSPIYASKHQTASTEAESDAVQPKKQKCIGIKLHFMTSKGLPTLIIRSSDPRILELFRLFG